MPLLTTWIRRTDESTQTLAPEAQTHVREAARHLSDATRHTAGGDHSLRDAASWVGQIADGIAKPDYDLVQAYTTVVRSAPSSTPKGRQAQEMLRVMATESPDSKAGQRIRLQAARELLGFETQKIAATDVPEDARTNVGQAMNALGEADKSLDSAIKRCNIR